VADAAVLPDKRAVERVLRDAGLSARQAKRLIGGGWPALARDVEDDLPALLRQAAGTLERVRDAAPGAAADGVKCKLSLDCDRDDPARAPAD
jgi:hypothetical protein